jgi:hypothetical protein
LFEGLNTEEFTSNWYIAGHEGDHRFKVVDGVLMVNAHGKWRRTDWGESVAECVESANNGNVSNIAKIGRKILELIKKKKDEIVL